MAVHLDWPQATYVRRVVNAEGGALVVERMTDYGDETLRLELPAVLTVVKDLNSPRLPSLASQMQARRATVERWTAHDIDGDPAQFGLDGSPTRVVSVFAPPKRGECVMWDGDAEDAVRQLLGALRGKGLV